MNLPFTNPLFRKFFLLTCIAAIMIIAAISIELFYRGFLFIETALQTSSWYAGQYFGQFTSHH